MVKATQTVYFHAGRASAMQHRRLWCDDGEAAWAINILDMAMVMFHIILLVVLLEVLTRMRREALMYVYWGLNYACR